MMRLLAPCIESVYRTSFDANKLDIAANSDTGRRTEFVDEVSVGCPHSRPRGVRQRFTNMTPQFT